MMSALFELQSAGVQFGPVAALAGVSLTIHRGERVALLGSNGSGKSTLLRLLNGLCATSSGGARFDVTARQAMLFQRPYMLRTSARNNVALGLWLKGQTWSEARASSERALERVGLAHLALRHARTLSGGQQQRLALARAWVLQPDVLLLDEPTASLDPHAKREVEALMDEFARGHNAKPMTMIFASHNLGQVKRLASRVLYLEQGRLLADLPVGEFFSGPRLREVSEAAHLFVKGEST